MGSACKFTTRPNPEAIISVDRNEKNPDQSSPKQKLELKDEELLKNHIRSQKIVSDIKIHSTTNNSIHNSEFEESIPKQFVEVQVNHFKKQETLNNDDESIESEVNY